MSHPAAATDLFGAIGALWFLLMLGAMFVFGLAWPLMMFSVTLNIRGIRRELRDIAEQLSLPSRRL